jgi:hypothetical protein
MTPQFLAGEDGLYRARPTSFVWAFLTQTAGVAVLIAIAAYVANHPSEIGRRVGVMIEAPISFPFTPEKPGGHGGGGTHDKLAASRGALPAMTLAVPLAPPEAVLLNQRPLLPEPASVMALSAVPLPPPGRLGTRFRRYPVRLRMDRAMALESAANAAAVSGPAEAPASELTSRAPCIGPASEE